MTVPCLDDLIAPRFPVKSMSNRERRWKRRTVDVEDRATRPQHGFLRWQEAQKQRHSLTWTGNAKVLLAQIKLRCRRKINHSRRRSCKRSERIAPPSRSQQLVGCDRQVANSFAGRVIDSIGDRGRRPDDANLADPARAHGIRVRIMLVEPNSVEVAYVGMGGDVVARKVVIDDVTEPRIEDARLVQRHRQTYGHASDEL